MGKIGKLTTSATIDKAMTEIRHWLNMLQINGLEMNMNYDARMNVAILKFRYKGVAYEFRSTKQANCRLNMWGITRVMEYKVRSHLMGIEDFEKSMKSYLAIENKSDYKSEYQDNSVNESYYTILGINKLSSNEEIKKRYIELVKTFHPDMALSSQAKLEFEKRLSEINEAYTKIKKERKI